jgi:hypothetical protein
MQKLAATVAQLEERQPEELGVGGSSPSGGTASLAVPFTSPGKTGLTFARVAQRSEFPVHTRAIVGSNPTPGTPLSEGIRMRPHDTKAQGERSTGAILGALVREGRTVLLPFGDNQRYDLVVEENGSFVRVQCKTARLIENGRVLEFATCSSRWDHKPRRDYRGQADLFGVYSPELDRIYLVPVESVGKTAAYLRLVPCKNKQKQAIRYASDFEFPRRK